MNEDDYTDPIEWAEQRKDNPPTGTPTSEDIPPEKTPRRKLELIIVASGALVIAIPIVAIIVQSASYKLGVGSATKAMSAAKERCGYDPIGISPRLVNVSGQTNGYSVRIASGTGRDDERYYCSLSEAYSDGYDRQRLNSEASDEIKRLYP